MAHQGLSNIAGVISKLIWVKFKNSLETINNQILELSYVILSGKRQEVKKSKRLTPGSDFTDQIFTGKLSRVDSAGALREGVHTHKT